MSVCVQSRPFPPIPGQVSAEPVRTAGAAAPRKRPWVSASTLSPSAARGGLGQSTGPAARCSGGVGECSTPRLAIEELDVTQTHQTLFGN